MPTGTKSAIGATALQLSTRTIRNRAGIRVKAVAGNASDLIYVGGPNVTALANDATDGFQLAANAEIVLPPSQFPTIDRVYVIGSATGLKASWFCDGEETLGGSPNFGSPSNSMLIPVLL